MLTGEKHINLSETFSGITLSEIIAYALNNFYSIYYDSEGAYSSKYNPIFIFTDHGAFDPYMMDESDARSFDKKAWTAWPNGIGVTQTKIFLNESVFPILHSADFFAEDVPYNISLYIAEKQQSINKLYNYNIKNKILSSHFCFTKEDVSKNEIILSIIFLKTKAVKRIYIKNIWSVCASLTKKDTDFPKILKCAKKPRELANINFLIKDATAIKIKDKNIKEIHKQLLS